MAAVWAAKLGLAARIIDGKAAAVVNGHADGLQSRTFEIMESFGFGDAVYKESNRMQQICIWVSGRVLVTRKCLPVTQGPGRERRHSSY